VTPRYVIESGDGSLLAETDSLFLALSTLHEDGEPFPVQVTDRNQPSMPIIGFVTDQGHVGTRS
jgi:hypothetical protein